MIKTAHIILLVIPFILFGASGHADILPNTHIYGLVEVDRFCAGQEPSGEYVRIQIYKTKGGEYLTYIMNVVGSRFDGKGGTKRSTLNNISFVTKLEVGPGEFGYSEIGTMAKGGRRAVSEFFVTIDAEEDSCNIASCGMSVAERGAASACEFRCYPEECEVRKGPAS